MTARYFPVEEYEARWQRVHDEMRRRGYDAAVVWGRSAGTYDRCGDVLYLANYYSTHSGQGIDTRLHNARSFSAVILQQGETPELHADEPWPRRDLIATDRIEWHYDAIKGTADAVNRRGLSGRVALVGSDFLPMKYWWQLEAATPDVTWAPEDDLVRSVRRIKSPRELDCFRTAGGIATRALDALMEGLIAGKTEAEAAAEASKEVVRGGGAVHMIPCSHGDMIGYFTREPLTGYGHDAPKPGDLVRAWVYGPMHQGYYLDPGRTAVAGRKPGAGQRSLVEDCANIVETVMAAVRPGAQVIELARLGDRMTAEVGGEKDQAAEKWPLYGHGVGLFFEPPYLGTRLCEGDEVIEAGMVMGVEAFLARSGVGSAGCEQNFIVGDDENELLTTSPMLWW